MKDERSAGHGEAKGRDLDIKRIVAAQYLQINRTILTSITVNGMYCRNKNSGCPVTALGRLRRLCSLRLGKRGLAPFLCLAATGDHSRRSCCPSSLSRPVLPSIHNSSSSSLLSSLFFLSSSSSSPLPHPSNSPFISLNLHHDVQKRSAAIQPRRGRCLCHWPDRFGEFSSVSSIPSGSSCPHPYLYNHLYHVPTTLPIYLPTIDIHRVFRSMDTIMPLNSLFTSPSIFPGRA